MKWRSTCKCACPAVKGIDLEGAGNSQLLEKTQKLKSAITIKALSLIPISITTTVKSSYEDALRWMDSSTSLQLKKRV